MENRNYFKFLLNIEKKILKNYSNKNNQLKFNSKKNFQIDPVTKLDLKTEKIIRNEIKKKFPNTSIIGEEYDNELSKSEYIWFIDPIDGTKSLIMGLPTWSILISLFKDDKNIFSYAYFPILKERYFAFKGKTFKYMENKKTIIKCNSKVKLRNIKLTINTLHSLKNKKVNDFLKKYKGFFKVTGVDAYNFCSIANGKFDVLIESGLKLVDIMPLLGIIQNSGAIITDWKGGDNFKTGNVLVSTNRKIHEYFLKIIKN